MVSMSHDPAAGAVGVQLVGSAAGGIGAGAAASAAVTALAPAGADEVSLQAAALFAAEGAAFLALHTASQEELARAGAALTDISRMYAEVDGEAAGVLDSAGGRIAGQRFVGPRGGGLIRAETVPGAGGSAARTPPLADLVEGTPVVNPSPTVPPTSPAVPSPATAIPGAANAASTLLGAGAAPLSSLGSLAQGATAGGATGPGLASPLTGSLAGEHDDITRTDPGDQQPGERLV